MLSMALFILKEVSGRMGTLWSMLPRSANYESKSGGEAFLSIPCFNLALGASFLDRYRHCHKAPSSRLSGVRRPGCRVLCSHVAGRVATRRTPLKSSFT